MTNRNDKNDSPPDSVPPEPKTHKGDRSFSSNSFAVLIALFDIPVFFTKNDYEFEIFPQWIYQLLGVALQGLLLVLILRLVYGAYRTCLDIGSYAGDELPKPVASGESFKWKDFVTQAGRRNLILGAIVLALLIYLLFCRV
ncbi:MAG: hypothetical protein ISS70_19195 [Phycisphaerae bacterium]|nr:hypothetical protein [Phycisphaerae bacterium]